MIETDAEYWMRRWNEAIAERDEAVRLLERLYIRMRTPLRVSELADKELCKEINAYLAKAKQPVDPAKPKETMNVKGYSPPSDNEKAFDAWVRRSFPKTSEAFSEFEWELAEAAWNAGRMAVNPAKRERARELVERLESWGTSRLGTPDGAMCDEAATLLKEAYGL